MEDEDNPVLSRVKLEIDIAEEPVGDWMRLQAWHAQEIARRESQHISHSSSQWTGRSTADVTDSKLEMNEEPSNKAALNCDMMEPHDPVLSKVKTEPDSDGDEELPVFFGITKSSVPLETEAVRGKSWSNIGTHQMKSEIPSTHAAHPECSSFAVSPTVSHLSSSAVEFSPATDAFHSDVSVPSDQERGTKGEQQQGAYSCDVCQKTFTKNSLLKRHESVHTGEKNHICGVCNKTFAQAGHLKRHSVTHTGEKTHACDVCEKAFTLASRLKEHKFTHTKEKNYHVCDVCCKAFPSASHLRRHKLIHTGEKNHVCEVCSKAFTQASNLKLHKLSHTGEKNHVCDVCNKAFPSASHLKRHELTHTGEKNHVCDVCNRAFALANHLKRHKLTHTGEKNHVCDVCNRSFALANHMKRHKLTHIPILSYPVP